MRLAIRRLCMGGAIVLLATAVLGVMVHVSIKDRVPVVSAFFYATPLVVSGLLALGAGGLFLKAGTHRIGGLAAILGVLLLICWLRTVHYRNGQSRQTGSTRVMMWNVARPKGQWDGLRLAVSEHHPDLLGLVESGDLDEKPQAFWRTNFADYDVRCPGGGIVLLARGKIIRSGRATIGDRSRIAYFDVALSSRTVRAIVVDVDSNPLMNRRPVIEDVLRVARCEDGTPTFILGDFNTPNDSVWFDPLRHDFKHAFEAAGSGMFVTWPTYFPVLAIDHIWVPRSMQVVDAFLDSSPASDHRMMIADVLIATQG